ncbi:MAG: peptidoglycan DD-metalloendopeptidase family protein [Gemmatimonadaceae bacterium]|nr:peptidoglycan DD-metalloendopeptidase family protein [Chitinophagaceae bacterium]
MPALTTVLQKHQLQFFPVVKFDPLNDKLLAMDFTAANEQLSDELLADTALFSDYIKSAVDAAGARYGIGGYGEHRTIYSRSTHFNAKDEPRRLHLGTDIWGPAGTPVFAFQGGMVHSVAYNDHFGDYGATMILSHQLDTLSFYTLYGHISKKDIGSLWPGRYLMRGQEIAHFGVPDENGHWPPHLHFQIISDMGMREGDYPGVCKFSEKEKWMAACPDPDLILQMNKYL